MNEEEERKRFEAWLVQQELHQGTDRYGAEHDYFSGEYKAFGVQLAWLAWLEAIGGER